MKNFTLFLIMFITLNSHSKTLHSSNSKQQSDFIKDPIVIAISKSIGIDTDRELKKLSRTKYNKKKSKLKKQEKNNKSNLQEKIDKAKKNILKKKIDFSFDMKSFGDQDDFINNKVKEKNKFIKDKVNLADKLFNKWKKEYNQQLNLWNKQRSQFLKNIPIYKKGLVDFNNSSLKKTLPLDINKKLKRNKELLKKFFSRNKKVENTKSEKKSKKSSAHLKVNWQLINSAFVPKIKNQGSRPTCAAFTGIRGIEILMAQNNQYSPLSEQYFYYSSKPNCQKNTCSKRGSWSLNGYLTSKSKSKPDIPLLKDCPYNSNEINNNETQIPLKSKCFNGIVGINNYYEIKNKSQIQKALKKNYPIIGAFKLSDNFYKNDGAIFLKDASKYDQTRKHSAGHAVLIVGVMKLPKKYHITEGNKCYVLANSWGQGWGKGGYACISEKWFDKFKYDIDFIALTSIKI